MARSDAKLRLLHFYLSEKGSVSYELSLHNEPVGALTRRSERIELKQRALDARNAARKFLLDHKRLRPLYDDKARVRLGLKPGCSIRRNT